MKLGDIHDLVEIRQPKVENDFLKVVSKFSRFGAIAQRVKFSLTLKTKVKDVGDLDENLKADVPCRM